MLSFRENQVNLLNVSLIPQNIQQIIVCYLFLRVFLNLLNHQSVELHYESEFQLKSTGNCLNNASCKIFNVLPEYSEKVLTVCKWKI